MNRRSRPTFLGLLTAACLAALLAVPLTEVPAQAAPPSPSPGGPGSQGLLHRAEQALEQVQDLLSGQAPATAPGAAHGPDLTMALRNLTQLLPALPSTERAEAERILARPTNSGTGCGGDYACYAGRAKRYQRCNSRICVHYVRRGSGAGRDNTNGVPTEDDGARGHWPGRAGNGVPDMVEFTLSQMARIDKTYRAAGYRSTKGDGRRGGDSRRDIYLGNVGDSGVYGYCTSDDPRLDYDGNGAKHYTASAYCVLDNDYSTSEFPALTPRKNLEVTAAHEYFHAVQFAYDYDEDAWLMEATATWAEDEVYDNIDDNRSYLPYGPIKRPGQPVDLYSGLHEYGAWIFFRYLTERHPASDGGLPVLVRKIWRNAVGTTYSLQAIDNVLRASYGVDLTHDFILFSLANRHPKANYSEGGAYPHAPLTGDNTLAAGGSVTKTPSLDHLTVRHFRFKPGSGMGGSSATLDLSFTMPATSRGATARINIRYADGHHVRRTVNPGALGSGSASVPFTRGAISSVEVALLNTSTRYTCHTQTSWWEHTCGGSAQDDNLGYRLVAKAVAG